MGSNAISNKKSPPHRPAADKRFGSCRASPKLPTLALATSFIRKRYTQNHGLRRYEQ